ncbi:MAG: molybdopterin-dependent oxidoreductase [Geminicoccaceae bacterium]
MRLAWLALCLLLPMSALADTFSAPKGQSLLEIADADKVVVFDRQMLETLGMNVIETTTDWTEGMQRFSGPKLADVLAAADVLGGELSAVAINDYTVAIPRDFAERHGAMLALSMNGKPMSVRDKGPIWLVFPRDDDQDLQRTDVNAYWIWQLARIDVR